MKKLLIMSLVFAFYFTHAQEFALKQLENSPRHHEWVKLDAENDRKLTCFIAFPEKAGKTIAVIVIHENRGLTDWVRSFADQLAKEGYIAIAPDLLSDFDDKHTKTSEFENSDAAREAIYELDENQVTQDLNLTFDYIKKLEACNGKIAVAGFCWGGSQSFRYATNKKELAAAMVFYGSAPKEESDIKRIYTNVYGFYGENDQRINAGIKGTEEMMVKNGKNYNYEIYKGAGHAFMRRGEETDGSAENVSARNDAWTRLLSILSKL